MKEEAFFLWKCQKDKNLREKKIIRIIGTYIELYTIISSLIYIILPYFGL